MMPCSRSGERVQLVPDTGATNKWELLASALRQQGVSVVVNTSLEERNRPPNWDLADEFLMVADETAAALTVFR